jgi:MoxR-vWA-beta-propeller ternary system domain bpX5
MSAVGLALRWAPREPPLPAVAVVGTGAAGARLRVAAHERVLAGTELRATGNAGWIVLLGDASDLPWADGAAYLGWDAGLLVPTASAPWPPADLVRAAVRRAAGTGDGLVVLLPDRLLVSPVPARRLDPARLLDGAG